MKNLAKTLLYCVVAAAVLGTVLPTVAKAACPQHQQAAPCDCCSVQAPVAPCETLCQSADAVAIPTVITQEEAKQSKRLAQAKIVLSFVSQADSSNLVGFSYFATTTAFGSPRLYLQSHNLRL